MRTVLFYRNFKKFHGGHLKIWEYFNHVLSSPDFTPRIGFSPKTRWDESNPWWEAREYVVDDWDAVRPDIFFVAGRDWARLDQHPRADDGIPVVNLLQHVRHADPEGNRYEFLSRRAVRLCVSEVVADAVRATGVAQGPVMAIPISIDLSELPFAPASGRDIDVLIAGLKQPDLARELAARLSEDGRRSRRWTGSCPARSTSTACAAPG